MSAAAQPVPHVVIEPSRGWRALDLRELWRFRELAYFLALRDIKVRYKQTALGVAWVVLQPLLATGIFSIVFGSRGLATDGVPYPLFVVSGLVPWFYFANATAGASGSIVGNAQLISKVYFPRLAIPLAAVLANLVDLGIGAAAAADPAGRLRHRRSSATLAGAAAAGRAHRADRAGRQRVAGRARRAVPRRALRRARSCCRCGSSPRRSSTP